MSFSQHYDWYKIKNVLTDYFDCKIIWDRLGMLICTRGDKKVLFAKKNNFSIEYVEEILRKIDISIDEFRIGYDKIFHR